jgi:large-conductance mechanosensitive channel
MIVLAIVFAPAGAIVQVIINLLIGLVVNIILSQIDNPILRFLVGMILGGLSNFVASGFNLSALTLENFLPSAQDLIGLASEIYQQSLQEKAEEQRKKELQEQWNERDRKYFSELNSMPKIMPVLRVENQVGATYDMLGPEAFYNRMYGEPLWSYETLYDVDTAINQRITVKSG